MCNNMQFEYEVRVIKWVNLLDRMMEYWVKGLNLVSVQNIISAGDKL